MLSMRFETISLGWRRRGLSLYGANFIANQMGNKASDFGGQISVVVTYKNIALQ
jgi:hypothetical protein